MNNKTKHKAKVWLKIIILILKEYTIIRVVQATYHQGDVRYSTSFLLPQQVGQVLTQTWNDLKRPTTRKKQPTTIWTYQQQGKKDAKPPTTTRFWDYFTVWGNRFSSLARFPSNIWLQSFEHRFMENYGENRALNIYYHVYLLRDIIFTGYVANHCHIRKFIFASQR